MRKNYNKEIDQCIQNAKDSDSYEKGSYYLLMAIAFGLKK